jgi:L-histidine N-alpha-methyltransferase
MAVYRNQVGTIDTIEKTPFYRDVMQGLSSNPKFLQSKYFYDAEGDRLFREIMQLPEYYPTRCELEIFTKQTKELAAPVLNRLREFDVLELGAGDAVKSTNLLRYLKEAGKSFTYFPVDISQNVIQLLEKEMPQRIRDLNVQGLRGDYFEMIKKSYQVSDRRKLVLFMGANIGNFTPEEAEHFLSALNDELKAGDLLLIGFDLKKNPKTILSAYNDAAGVTKAFNLNLLRRINRELQGDFNLQKFDHFPTYDPVTGTCKSYIISQEEQEVRIGNEVVSFYTDEPVWTELSQKYSTEEISELAIHTGFHPIAERYDGRHWFVDCIWEKI